MTFSAGTRYGARSVKRPGDLTPRSASEVLADRGYKMVFSEQAPQIGGQLTNTLVVMHCGTETYWATVYPVMQSTSPMTWQQVEPVVETRTSYRPVP